MSEDSKYAHRVEDAEEHRQKRLNLTEQEKHLQQLVDTEAHRRKREKLGEQEKEKSRKLSKGTRSETGVRGF